MNKIESFTSNSSLDWNNLRNFLAIVKSGSLTKASTLLGVSQPTLSRHISVLEKSLGVKLFDRRPHGISLTEAGSSLVIHINEMQILADELSIIASAEKKDLGGTVRISSSEGMSAFILVPIIANLRRLYPEIKIELLVSDHSISLVDRYADITITLKEPKQPNVIAKKVGVTKVGLFAHLSYLKKFEKQMQSFDQAIVDPSNEWIGLDKSDLWLKNVYKKNKEITRDFFCLRCDNKLLCWQMALNGLGIVPSLNIIAAKHAEMVQVFKDEIDLDVPIWLTTNSQLRTNKRIRLVFDTLYDGIRNHLSIENKIDHAPL